MKKPKFLNELGEGNKFVDHGAQDLSGRLFVTKGTNNIVEIGGATKFKGSIEFQGKGNKVLIGQNCHFRGDIVVKGNNQLVSFGDYSTSVNVYILCQEGCDVRVGKWCMFSREIEIRTTDAHSVIDRSTGKRINKPGSVNVGDHVWVGVGAILNKGSAIPSDCIVGAMSFVNDVFEEEGTILAGMPARIVKRGITWNRSSRDHFTMDEMDHWKKL